MLHSVCGEYSRLIRVEMEFKIANKRKYCKHAVLMDSSFNQNIIYAYTVESIVCSTMPK